MKAMIIKTDGFFSICEIKKGYKEKMRIVHGGFECVSLDDSIQMFINETGKIDNLPVNSLATALLRSYYMTEDFIAGDAVICGCKDCESCDLSDDQIEEIKKRIA